MLIVLTTTPTKGEAEVLAEKIVGARLAACVQILPEIRSVYYWNCEVRSEAEHLLLIKTLDENYAELESFIRSNHSYEVPEIIAVSAENTSETYLAWMKECLQK